MATLLDLLSRTRIRLGEPTPGFWTDAEIRGHLNEACRDIARRSEALLTDATLTIVAGTVTYALPTTLVKIHKPITFTPTGSSHRYPLEPVDRSNAITRWGIGQDINTGTPSMCTTTGYAGNLSLIIYPKPAVGGTVNYRYSKFTTDLNTSGSQDGTSMDIPAGWEDIAVDYAEWRCWSKRRDADSRAMAQQARTAYDAGLAGIVEASQRVLEVPGEITRDPFWPVNDDWGW